MADFAERLKELRLKRGVSQQELADYLNVNKQTISGYERGIRRPAGEGAREIYEKLADYFNVDIPFLMGISDLTTSLKNPLSSEYYDNAELLEKAQALFDSKEMRLLFDAAKDSRPEDLQMAADLLQRLKGTNPNG